MIHPAISRCDRLRTLTSGIVMVLVAGFLVFPAPAKADAAGAKEIVKAMSDYMASQKNLTGEFDVELDVITPELEKVQFSASGSVLLERPNKVRLIRKGGYTEVELMSDGKTVTIEDLVSGSYSQVSSPGSVDQVVDLLRAEYGIDMPGADLVLTNSYSELMDGVLEAKHIGVGIIGGVECEHLAFRNADTDWQLWVQKGARPLPCKYVISSKTVAAAPDYTVRFRNWSVGRTARASAFRFSPLKGGKRVAFEELSGIGELPPAAPFTPGGR